MLRLGSVVFCAVLAASCQTARIEPAFDASAAAYVLEKGSGRIEGEAFLRKGSGSVMTAAGERVYLIPATDYAVARFDKMFGGDRRAYAGAGAAKRPKPTSATAGRRRST